MAEPEPHSTRPFGERNGQSAVATRNEIRKHIHDLLSDDFATRSESIEELEKFGAAAADALVDTLVTKCTDPHASSSLTDALEEIGRPAATVLIHALKHVPEVRRPQQAYLLENLIDTLGRLQDRRAAGPLAEQIDKLNRAIRRNHDRVLVDICEAARVRIHECLAEMGDRRGVDDLLRTIGDGRKRVRAGVVEALRRVGDRRALVPLLRLHTIEDDVSLSGAADIRDAFRAIARREKVAASDKMFKALTREERAAFGKLFPKPARSGPRTGGGR